MSSKHYFFSFFLLKKDYLSLINVFLLHLCIKFFDIEILYVF